jgi:hypothetical protein
MNVLVAGRTSHGDDRHIIHSSITKLLAHHRTITAGHDNIEQDSVERPSFSCCCLH